MQVYRKVPIVDISQKADLVAGKVPASQLPLTADSIGIAELKPSLKAEVNLLTGNDIDFSLGIQYLKTLTGNTTLTFSNLTIGKTITLVVSGNFTLTFPVSVDVNDLSSYDGTKTNYIQMYCVSSSVVLVSLKVR